MRVNKVFISGLVLFEPILTKTQLFHYNMIGFLTNSDKANIVKIVLSGTNAIQFCKDVGAHDMVHIEGSLANSKVPKKESDRAYIAPVVYVDSFAVLSERERREFIDVDFPKSITKLLTEIGQKYDPFFARNLLRGGGNLQ
jgi:hypothetical protein